MRFLILIYSDRSKLFKFYMIIKNKIILLIWCFTKISPEVRNKFKNLLIDTWKNDHRKIRKSLFDLGFCTIIFQKIEAIFLDFFYEATYPIREKNFIILIELI